MCNLTIPEADNPPWYVPDVTGGHPKAKMIQICEAALSARGLPEEYWERYRYELSVLSTSPAILNSYLVTYDVVGFCRDNNIPVAARGSMAGSLISWLMDITLEDPIKWALSFSRAVNPARPSIPDFDLDVSSIRRPEILEYLREKYNDNIPIAAYSHYGPKGALKKVFRMEGLREFKDINEITKLLPDGWPEGDGAPRYDPKSKRYIGTDPWWDNIPEQYRNYVGIYKGVYSTLSAHPSGIIISGKERELKYELPLQWIASSKQLVSAYDMYTLKKMGLYKLDLLGLRTIDQLDYMERLSGAKLPDDNYDDPDVLWAFRDSLLAEIFQMDGWACRHALNVIQGAQTFEDLIAVNSLARPGSKDFLPFYRTGNESLITEYPLLQEVLGPTRGLILYQEQVMEIARILADFDDAEQDDIKESIKYFNHDNWSKTIEPKFQAGAEAKGINPTNILESISKMANYTYNRAHAMTYAAIAYKMMWYKVYYPAVYYAAVYDGTEDKQRLILESHQFKVKWHPADVNNSESSTVIRNGEIYLGLSSIKGVGPAACKELIRIRPFTSVEDLTARVEKKRCNNAVITKLQDAFAFSSLGVRGKLSTFQENFGFNYRYMDHELVQKIYGMNGPGQIAGFISNLRSIIITKSGKNEGKEMCITSLLNSSGTTKCVMFPDTWNKARGKLYTGQAIIFKGEYQVSGDFIVSGGEEIE